MDGAVASFGVHVQSLADFAQRLREQVDEIQRPIRTLTEINQHPELPLGSFAEAFSLSDDHADIAAEMAVLLGRLARAVEFAATATRIVADRYQALDAAGAQRIAASAGEAAASATATATPPAGSLAVPEGPVEVFVPAQPGTVYYYNGSTAEPISIAVEVQDV